MKKKIALIFWVVMTACAVYAFPADYNNSGATMGQQMGEQPATGISKSANKPGVYDFKPKEVPTAQAQQTADKAKNLDDIVVTARKIPELISIVPRSIEVIAEEQIKAFGAERLADLIESISGITVIRSGGYEGINTVMFRGSPSKHTLVMQDGVPVNDMLVGTVDLNMIDISDVERIEIIKGGMSSIYGASASAGVINIITGSKNKKLLKAEASYGSFETQKYVLSSAGKILKVDYSAGASEERSKGYAANGDFYKRAADVKLQFDGDLLTSSLTGHYLKREMGLPYDDYGPSHSRQQDENYSMNMDEDVKIPYVNMKIQGYLRSANLYMEMPDYAVKDRHKKKEYQASVMFIYDEKGMVSAISGYENNIKEIDSTRIGKQSISNQASVSSVSIKLFDDTLLINTGFRADFNSAYNNSTSENLSGKYKFAGGTEFFASMEKSVAVPTFGDTYWNEPWMAGNPKLLPEKTTSLEAGIRKKDDIISEEISWFRSDIKDLIEWVTDPFTYFTSAENVANAEIAGAEAKVDLKISGWLTAYARYTYLIAKNRETKKDLAYRPKNEINAGASIKFPFNTSLSVTGKYVDNRYSTKDVLLHPYYLISARVTHKISDNFEIYGDLSNILDNTSYESVILYKMPGRSITVGLRAEI